MQPGMLGDRVSERRPVRRGWRDRETTSACGLAEETAEDEYDQPKEPSARHWLCPYDLRPVTYDLIFNYPLHLLHPC